MAKTFTRESHGFALRIAESGTAWLVWIRPLSDDAPVDLWGIFDDERSAKQAACAESKRRAGLAPIGNPSDCDCESLWTERLIVPCVEAPSPSLCPRCRQTMMGDHLDQRPELQNIVLIGKSTVRRAEQLILACEACNPGDAHFPFDYVLDFITGRDPGMNDYLLQRPAKCPSCWRPVKERTLVDWAERLTEPDCDF